MYVCMSACVCARVHPHPPTSSTHLHPCRSPECRHIRLYMSVSYVDLARICTLAVVLSSLLSGICTVAVVLGLFCFTKTALYHASDIVVNIIICTLAVVLGRALPHHSGRLGSYPRPRPALPALLVHAWYDMCVKHHVRTCISVHIDTYLSINTYIHIHIYLHVHMYVI